MNLSQFLGTDAGAGRLTPLAGVWLALSTVLLINVGMIFYLLSLPVLGVPLSVDQQRIIISSDTINTHHELRAGVVVTALDNGQKQVELEPEDLLEEPDLLPTYELYNRFIQRQGALFEMLRAPELSIKLQDVGWISLPTRSTAWMELPILFWVQMLVANISIVVGSALWLFRRQDRAAFHYFLSGAFLALVVFPAAIYSSRELALPADHFRWLSVIDHLGLYLLMAAIISLLWCYPRPVNKWPVPFMMYGGMGLSWLADTWQLFPGLDFSTRIIPVVMLLVGIIILVMHWKKSAGDFYYQQSVKWFLLVIVAGCGLFILIVFVPPLFGVSPLVSQGLAFLAFLSIYLSLAFGVFRFQLFDLDRWWFEAWVWVAVALFVLTVDVLFVVLLSLPKSSMLWIVFVSFGWVYFPMRQWLMKRYFSSYQKTIGDYLPLVVRYISQTSPSEDLAEACQFCLLEIYSPLSYKVIMDEGLDFTLVDKGVGVQVVLPDKIRGLVMMYPDHGRQLFKTADLKIINALVELFTQAMLARKARESSIRQERERIKQDVHDTLGGSLLSIMRQKDEPNSAAKATIAWRELRDILSALEGKPCLLSQVLDQWHADARQQLREAKVTLDWQVEDSVRHRVLSLEGQQRINLGQIFRESLTNAIRHSSANIVEIHLDIDDNQLKLTVSNNGVVLPPDEWQSGRGMHHIRQRAAKLNGNVSWRMQIPDTVKMCLHVAMDEFNEKSAYR